MTFDITFQIAEISTNNDDELGVIPILSKYDVTGCVDSTTMPDIGNTNVRIRT